MAKNTRSTQKNILIDIPFLKRQLAQVVKEIKTLQDAPPSSGEGGGGTGFETVIGKDGLFLVGEDPDNHGDGGIGCIDAVVSTQSDRGISYNVAYTNASGKNTKVR